MKTILAIFVVAALLCGCVLTPSAPERVISVESTLPGASAEVVESTVTAPVEKAVQSLSGAKAVRSSSSQGRSYVEIYFSQGERRRQLQQVQTTIDALKPKLPSAVTGLTVKALESATLQ